MKVLFWICLALTAYVYCGYPLILLAGLFGRRKPVRRGGGQPKISVLVPAHNEESVIWKKLENLLTLDYPRESYEIIVGSDGSTDKTADIVIEFGAEGVRLIDSSQQQGKSAIQNLLVAESKSEIIVFTDADCWVPPEALRILAENFADPEVGLVTANPVYANRDETDVTRNEGLYWRYESWLRQQESDRRLLCMASGSLFGMRRSLWKPLDPRCGDDFVLPLQVALRGFRNIVNPRIAVSSELTQKNPSLALKMRKRIVSKDLRGLYANKSALNPLQTGALAFGLLSHKLLRWLVPIFLLGLFMSNLFLLWTAFYRLSMIAQILFYTFAVAGAFRSNKQPGSLWSVPFAFCVMNLGVFLGTLHFVSGRTIGQWRPVRE
jgi:cellulose synthase/poly-beta-1,6-N-acetylglucosamine synthase-like glycosyltransferase